MTSDQARTLAPPSLAAKLANFALFQVAYAACVLGAAAGHPWQGALLGVAVLPLNLAFVPATRRREDALMWLAVCGGGTALDSALYAAGAIGFPPGAITRSAWPDFLVPPWIAVLWLAVGTMLRSSLAWLGRHKALAVGLSAIGGPLSFWSGARLGATELPMGVASLITLGFEYAVVLPLLLHLTRTGVPSEPAPVNRPTAAP